MCVGGGSASCILYTSDCAPPPPPYPHPRITSTISYGTGGDLTMHNMCGVGHAIIVSNLMSHPLHFVESHVTGSGWQAVVYRSVLCIIQTVDMYTG